MTWKYILKSPIFAGEPFEQPTNEKGDDFIWLQEFQYSDFTVKFVSEDKSTRAELRFSSGDNEWVLDLFVVNEQLRGQGKGQEALRELIYEVRENEKELLSKLYKGWEQFEESGKKNWENNKRSLRQASAHTPLPITLGSVEPDAHKFWEKMEDRDLGINKAFWKAELKVKNTHKIRSKMKPIPQPNNKPCWEKLKRGLEYLDTQTEHFSHAEIKWSEVPEEIACKVIEGLTSYTNPELHKFYYGFPQDEHVETDMQITAGFRRNPNGQGEYKLWIDVYPQQDFSYNIALRRIHVYFTLFRYEDDEKHFLVQNINGIINKFLDILKGV